ncbi:MAG: GNAT family N-acetyltransferase [Cellvibrionaceae bacterium]|nr:GNAT family N-acetyltransferase [Cellvibrionaceae bacterium]
MIAVPHYDIVDMRSLPKCVAEVARWHHNEWLNGHPPGSRAAMGAAEGSLSSVSDREHNLRAHLSAATIPTSFVAHCNQQPLGTVSLVNYRFSKEHCARQWITNLFVMEQFRGRGIALSLLQHCMHYARELGLKELNLYTRGLEGFYLKHGWQYSHRGMVQGQPVEVLKFFFDA